MSDLVLFRDNPGLNSVQKHVIDGYSVSQMERFLDSKNAEDLKLDGGQVVEKIIKFRVLSGCMDTLIDGDDQMVCLFD